MISREILFCKLVFFVDIALETNLQDKILFAFLINLLFKK